MLKISFPFKGLSIYYVLIAKRGGREDWLKAFGNFLRKMMMILFWFVLDIGTSEYRKSEKINGKYFYLSYS